MPLALLGPTGVQVTVTLDMCIKDHKKPPCRSGKASWKRWPLARTEGQGEKAKSPKYGDETTARRWKTALAHPIPAGKPRRLMRFPFRKSPHHRDPLKPQIKKPLFSSHARATVPCIVNLPSEGVLHVLLIWKDSLFSVANLSPSNINDCLLYCL